jgi:histidine phosphotransferase ChpT
MGAGNTNLAALIGSRICHDLISPIGAINNGLELLSLSGGAPGPELDLIGESVGSASARIRFFRIAFGAAGDQMVGRAEVVSILRDLYGGGRTRVEWLPEEPQPRAAVRLAFLAVLCVESALPYGGQITVREDGGSWEVPGRADKLLVDEALWALLGGAEPAVPVQPAQVQFALLPAVAGDDGRAVGYESGETAVVVRF